MIPRTIPLALAAAILLQAPQAAAQYSLAVLGVDPGAGPANRAACLFTGLKRQVKRAPGFDLVPGKNLDEIKLVFGCFNEAPKCMARAGKSLQVEKLLWGRVEARGDGLRLRLMLLDVGRARIEKTAAEAVTRRDLARSCAAEAVSRLATTLLATRRAGLAIRVNVPGARITVGPRFIGIAEASRQIKSELPPGTHLVQVKAKGYQNWEQQVTIAAGQQRTLDVELKSLQPAVADMPGTPPEVAPPSEEEGTPNLGWKVAFWGSAAATVGLAIGMGVTGSQVLSAEKDKEELITEYRQKHNMREALPPSHGDVCSDPKNAPGGSKLTDDEVRDLQGICDRGKSKALVTNVLIGVTVATAALTGFLYYKAYASGSQEAAAVDDSQVEVEKVSWTLTPSAGLGGAGVGFELTF